MNWKEIFIGILFMIITLVVSFVFIAQTVSYQFAVVIYVILALIGFAIVIDGLRRD